MAVIKRYDMRIVVCGAMIVSACGALLSVTVEAHAQWTKDDRSEGGPVFEDRRRLPSYGLTPAEQLKQATRKREQAQRAADVERDRRKALETELEAAREKVKQAEAKLKAAEDTLYQQKRRVAAKKKEEARKLALAKAKAEAERVQLAKKRKQERAAKEEQLQIERERRLARQATVRSAAARRSLEQDRALRVVEARRKTEREAAERDRLERERLDRTAREYAAGVAARAMEREKLQLVESRRLQQAEALAAVRRRFNEEALLAGRLAEGLAIARARRLRADKPEGSASTVGLPERWAEEERVRLELEERLASVGAEDEPSDGKVRSMPPRDVIGRVIKLRLKGSKFEIAGVLKKIDQTTYVIAPANSEDVAVPVARFECVSDVCPKIEP